MNHIIEKATIISDIMLLLVNNMGEDGLCRILQKEIASQVGRSASCISKTLINLEKYDNCIEKIAPSVYRVNHMDTLNYGPMVRVHQYLEIIQNHPDLLLKSLKDQAEYANMSVEDIKMVQGYFDGTFGTPFK